MKVGIYFKIIIVLKKRELFKLQDYDLCMRVLSSLNIYHAVPSFKGTVWINLCGSWLKQFDRKGSNSSSINLQSTT